MATNDNPEVERQLLAIKAGLAQVLTGGKTISFGGKSYDQTSLAQAVDAVLAPYSNVREHRTLLELGVEERRVKQPEAERFVNVVKHAAAAVFGEDSLEFSLLGFQPKRKAADLTPEQKTHKLELMRATRAARHTMGKRQKQAVKGDVSSTGNHGDESAKPATGHTP